MNAWNADVLVIGAGIVGCSAAWHLASGGARVTVLDAVGIGAGMTAIQPGGVRNQWGSGVTREFARESRAFYDNLSDRLSTEIDPGFAACGYTFVASTETTATLLQADVASQQADGVPARWLTADEVHALAPGLDGDQVLGATFNPEDGYFDRPGAPVAAFEDGCRRAGVTFATGRATQVQPGANGVVVQLADGRQLTADTVVVAAGIASAGLVAQEGYELPLRKDPKYLFYSDPIGTRLIEPLVVFADHHFAVKHLSDGSVLASDLTLGQAPGGGAATEAVDEQSARRQVTDLAKRLAPILEHVRYPVMVEGWYDVTPDAQLVVGQVPFSDRVWIAAGMNGRGMMLAPSVGRLVGDGIATGSAAAVPSAVSPHRFALEPAVGGGESRVI